MEATLSHAAPESADEPIAGPFRATAVLDESAEHDGTVAQAVQRAKAGDREAVHFLYCRYADNIYGYVRSILHDDHAAEDVTQHVFAKLMVVLPRYEQRDVPFFAWMLRVARNAALDHLRRQRPIPCEDVEPEPRVDRDVPGGDRGLTLREAFADIPDEQREVLFLRHVVGLSPGEIAERLGKTESSIHGLHHRGRGALKAALLALGAAPATAAG